MNMDASDNPLISKRTGKPIVSNVRRKVIDKHYDWGLYVYKKSNGKWFTDDNGSILNIPSMKGDIGQISKLKQAAMYNGDPGDGKAVFVPGLTRVTEEEYSEQMERLKQGLIPSMNDLGAWKAAQDTVDKYGRGVLDE
jgi:hypothetical protein